MALWAEVESLTEYLWHSGNQIGQMTQGKRMRGRVMGEMHGYLQNGRRSIKPDRNHTSGGLLTGNNAYRKADNL